LLQDQAYRLCLWRVAADEINYRRFFDVNELAAICMEKPEVFEATHRLTSQLLDSGQVSGLRIDHADGLFDPTAYLWHLQSRRFLQLCRHEFESRFTQQNEFSWSDIEPILEQQFGELRQKRPESPLLRSLYLLVEKILGSAEKLPDDWPVHGTTGYEFLNSVNGLFVDRRKARELDAVYAKFIGARQDFRELVYEANRLILKVSMSSELHVLGHQLDRISERNWRKRDFSRHGLIQALREVIACFPVYRTYTIARHVLDRDHQYIEHAIQDAKVRNPAVSSEIFDFIRSVLLHDAPAETSEEEWALRIQFVGRFQQFTGPMMAKAVEDTAFYRFHRLISLNEVGSHPEQFGTSVERFHEDNLERQRWHAHGMLTTSTHDTKRSEDVRARISLLSECASDWKTAALRWSRLNRKYKTTLEGKLAPSRNDEYLLYQTLVGAWPMQGPYEEELSEFVRRIQEYMLKAVREAKQFSSWIAPNEDY
jgi:(1->4)-alpha-D-glucan 1-alpha-D-glucosylmutase